MGYSRDWRDVDISTLGRNADRAAAEKAPKPKRSKMGNVRTMSHGRWFDSRDEAKRYEELRLLVSAGEIRKLECQPRYVLHTLTPSGEWVEVGTFRPDFRYDQVSTGQQVVEDVKSDVSRTEAYQMRKRHLEAEYAITLQEIG